MNPITKYAAAGALMLFAAAMPAQAQHGQDKKHEKDKHEQGKAVEKQQQQVAVKQQQVAVQQQKVVVQQQKAVVDQQKAVIKQVRLSNREQQLRIQEQQRRNSLYQQRLDQQLVAAVRLDAQLQQQRRLAQYRNQQRYIANLRQQQALLRTTQNYQNDPYYYTPVTYRYTVNGNTRQTNRYGGDLLKQAVRYGYAEGYRSGQADAQDRAPYNYRTTYAYTDANYGYNGQYVDQSDYNYYFREGLRRGYDDGYYSHTQYGTVTSGNPSILSSLITSIVNLVSTQ